MGESSSIGWTNATFNIVLGCTPVSPGCANCYAEKLAKRNRVGWGPNAARRTLADSTWAKPLAWNRKAARDGVRRRVFCGSMGDVFEDHPTVNRERQRLWPLIRQTPGLDWLLLTKRPERINKCLPDDWGEDGYPNVWIGTSIEDQPRADERLGHLANSYANGRTFVSAEPLLGPIDMGRMLMFIRWVIVGGESGPGFRPMEPEWADSIRQQCEEAEARNGSPVAFFYKQDAAYRSGTIAEPGRWPQDFPPGLWEPQRKTSTH